MSLNSVCFDQDSDGYLKLSVLHTNTITTTLILSHRLPHGGNAPRSYSRLSSQDRTPSSDYNIAPHHDPANALSKEIVTS